MDAKLYASMEEALYRGRITGALQPDREGPLAVLLARYNSNYLVYDNSQRNVAASVRNFLRDHRADLSAADLALVQTWLAWLTL